MSIVTAALAMADERGDTWWVPALYLQKSELEPASMREATRRLALDLARTQNSRSLERRIQGTISRTFRERQTS